MKNKYTLFIIGTMLTGLLVLAPVSTFAKDKGNKELKVIAKTEVERNDDNRKSDKSEDNKPKNKSCLRALGHLIAPGWIKHNGTLNLGLECNLPFGISKKFTGSNASTTPDTIRPVISAISATAGTSTAQVSWMTNEPATSKVFYSSSATIDVNATTTASVENTALSTSHLITVSGLATSTPYFLVAQSKDASGNKQTTSVFSITTSM